MVQTILRSSSEPEQLLAAVLPRTLGSAIEQRQILPRVFFSLMTIILIAMNFVEPHGYTLANKHVQQQAPVSVLLNNLLMGATAMLALADVLLNDIMSDKYKFFLGRRQRHIVWCVLALSYLCQALITAKLGYSVIACSLPILLGVWAATIAALDVVYELNEGPPQ